VQHAGGIPVKVIRSHPEANFTIIPNQALRDDRLSYTARGVLHELLSHRSGWETNADIMSARARQQRGAGVGEGRRAIRAAFAELEAAGYMVRVKERIPAGQQGAGRVVTTLHVYDTPQLHRGTAGGTSVDGTSVSGMPVTGTSVGGTSSIRTMGEDEENTIGEERAGQEHSASLAAARAAGQQAGPPVAPDRQRDLGYEAVDRLDDDVRRDNLLTLERMRPRIYRDCRRKAIAQIEGELGADAMRRPDASLLIDKLSYKYAVLHYSAAESWPSWFFRPLQAVG
jgi:hypothetical protein